MITSIISLLIISTVIITFFSIRKYTTEQVSFYPSNVDDWNVIDESYLLNGKLFYPKNFNQSKSYPGLILFHGLRGSLQNSDGVASKLASKGVICLSIDFHGHGKSGGVFPFDNPALYNATFPDAKGAYRFLNEKTYINTSQIAVFGQSLGGGAALYLALEGLTPKFVVWYPGSAYIYGNTPLYDCKAESQNFEGFIIQGTEDECVRCKPEYTHNFIDINSPQVEVKWIEGGKHGTGINYLTYLKYTHDWFYELWNLI